MREIKFRVYRTDKNEMYETASLQEIAASQDLNLVDFEVLEVMQFTGLLDASGVEIYEGDIIFPSGYPLNRFFYRLIEFHNGSFGYYDKVLKGEFYPLDQNKLKIWEVVGNKFQNPELIQ